MPHPKAPEWTPPELGILERVYVEDGLLAVMKLLPRRNDGAIHHKARKLGLRTMAQQFRLGGFMDIADEAWRLRHEEKLSYSSIGAELGVCEAHATNAVLYAECRKAGHRPIERSVGGKLLPAGRERLRVMFRKGWTHRKIQEWTGAPASMCSRERRRYAAELKAKGLAPLPSIGGGERYSGAKIPPSLKREVERLYLEGFGAAKITKLTGVSNTHCLRTRDKLIKRLKRKGQCLPGCDENGVRRVMRDHARRIPEISLTEFKRLIRQGETVSRAARLSVLGRSSADRIVHEMIAEGFVLCTKPGRGRGPERQSKQLHGIELPAGRKAIDRYRALVHGGASHAEAVSRVRAETAETARLEREARAAEAKTFEGQLAAVQRGAPLGRVFRPTRPCPEMTLGGIATGALA